MSRRVKSIIYYEGAQSMELAFHCTIQLCELKTRIWRKVEDLSRGRGEEFQA
ncbi:hypothetical protein J1N35_029130 [Gossypium stocksii]|uniref:Uncharacterized protein n=1 Tax=Gossypium stocksii TaxID=47602 RepID=A0A9D3UXE5_9ROSI|nr:hypothetical protein J1N35_029130 [Gossypium stocksii]